MDKVLRFFGWLLILSAILIVVFGVRYGIEEDHAFYARIDAYHEMDGQRDSLTGKLDSLFNLYADNVETDSVHAEAIQAQIDSIETSDEYMDLFAMPTPSGGFSMAYLISIVLFFVALIPLVIGILLVIAGTAKKNARTQKHMQEQQDNTQYGETK